jgi:hypothetical protein
LLVVNFLELGKNKNQPSVAAVTVLWLCKW